MDVKNLNSGKRTIPSKEVLISISNSLDKNNKMLALFLLYSGCKFNEAISILLKDIEKNNDSINVTIGNPPRKVALPEEFGNELLKYLIHDVGVLNAATIFFTDKNISQKSKSDIFRKDLSRVSLNLIGKPIGSHIFRKRYYIDMVESGKSVKEIKEKMGLSDIRKVGV